MTLTSFKSSDLVGRYSYCGIKNVNTTINVAKLNIQTEHITKSANNADCDVSDLDKPATAVNMIA
jgi:hypothetical protein